jgi:hypothetical protein
MSSPNIGSEAETIVQDVRTGLQHIGSDLEGIVDPEVAESNEFAHLLKGYDLERVKQAAADAVPVVQATCTAILRSDDQVVDPAELEEAWQQLINRESGGDPEPSQTYASIKELLETFELTLVGSGETHNFNGEPFKAVLVRSALSNRSIYIGTSAFLTRWPIKSGTEFANAHPTPTALLLLDAVIRNVAIAEMQARYALKATEKGTRGQKVDREGIPNEKLKDDQLEKWDNIQRMSAILVTEWALAYRNAIHKGEPLTEQMIIEALLTGAIPTHKSRIPSPGQIWGRFINRESASIGLGPNAELKHERIISRILVLFGLAYAGGKAAFFGGQDAGPEFQNLIHGVGSFTQDVPKLAEQFGQGALKDLADWKADLFAHGATALGLGITLFAIAQAYDRFHASRSPVHNVIGVEPTWQDFKDKYISTEEAVEEQVEENAAENEND